MSHTCETEQALKPQDQHENSQVSDWKKDEADYVSSRPSDREPGILKYYKRGDYFLAGVTTEDTSAQKHDENIALKKEQEGGVKQGTLLGVFFPVMQNILGVLLFIRVPAITGESGIRDSVLIVFVCTTTTFLTILSLSAIATNGKISTGGTYYILSRSLGAPIGTAVGFSFYLGTTFAGAMYILGAVESFIISTKLELAGSFQLSMRVYGTILLAVMIFLNIVGLKYVAKTGMVFLSVVLLAILGMYIGLFSQSARSKPDLNDLEREYKDAARYTGITGLSSEHWNNNWGTEYDENNFFILLSIYFPSVTGIMAGSNRSGDLADPSYSIPRGTLGAQLFTTVIYLSFPMLFGAVADRGTLQTEEHLIAAECSWPTKYLTIVAIILSSSGAGLQSLAGAPRLLLAVANDEHLPCFKCFKGNIRRIILFTGLICFGAVMIGDINVITPIITMFFLLCYGFVNLCCLFLDTVAFPNWRPTWRLYHKFLSFIGLSLCLFLMIAISWWSFLIALALAAVLFTIVTRNKNVNMDYGDSIEAVKLSTAKSSLHGLINSSKHVKNWIPIVLVLGDYKPEAKEQNKKIESEGGLFFLNTIKQDISFIVYGTSIEGDYTLQDCQKVKEHQNQIEDWMEKEKLQVITKVVQVQKREQLTIPSDASEQQKQFLTETYYKKPQQGILFLMQAAGLGGLEPNTLMVEFPKNFKADRLKAERFVQYVSYGVRFGKAVIATFNDQEFSPAMEQLGNDQGEPKRLAQETYTEPIDVWTFSYEQGLLILLTYFLKRSKVWKQCQVRLFIVSLQPKDKDATSESSRIKSKVQTFLERYRLATKGMQVEVELIEYDQWQQMQGYILTEGKQEQIQKNPEFQKAPVDPQSNWGMTNINENQEQQQQQQQQNNNGNGNLAAPQVKPERALSVMSHNQVSALNEKIQSKSRDSHLVIMNLPEPVNQKTSDYLEYLKNMTNGLKRVLMVRNSAQECVTEFT